MPNIDTITLSGWDGSAATSVAFNYAYETQSGSVVFTNPGATREDDKVLTFRRRSTTAVHRVGATLAVPYRDGDGDIYTLRFTGGEFLFPPQATSLQMDDFTLLVSSLFDNDNQGPSTSAKVPLFEMAKTGQGLY